VSYDEGIHDDASSVGPSELEVSLWDRACLSQSTTRLYMQLKQSLARARKEEKFIRGTGVLTDV
jgi:hypothetical protein